MKSQVSCPVCGNQTLKADTHELTVAQGSINLVVRDLENYICTTCRADPAFPEQVKRNELKIADAKRRAVGLLTGAEIRDLRDELGLSQADAALLFGGGPNAFSKYERGEIVQSVPMDRLLRVVDAHPYLIPFLRAQFLGSTYSGAISDSALQVFYARSGTWPQSAKSVPPTVKTLS